MPPSAENHDRVPTRADYTFFERISLRYADNDANGHVNNAQYYSFFDTASEGYLREHNLRAVLTREVRTLVVASSCRYYSEIAFPGHIQVGIKVARIGNSSIHYDIAIFREDDSHEPAAHGTFTVVCASRDTGRPISVPDEFRQHPQHQKTHNQ